MVALNKQFHHNAEVTSYRGQGTGVTRTQELGADLGYGLQGTALNE